MSKTFLGGSVPTSFEVRGELAGDHMVAKKRRLPINVKNGF
jgi:hypothetical protein